MSNIILVKDKWWVKEGSQIQIHVFPIQSSAIHRDSQPMIFFPFSVTISGISEASQSFLTTLIKFTASLSPRQKQSWLYNTRIAALFSNTNFLSVIQLLGLKNMDCFCCPNSKSNCAETCRHSCWSSQCSWCC